MLEHVVLHTLEDTVKLLPLLFLTYLGMEYLENRGGRRAEELLARAGKKGPVLGGLLGVIPQCGFSAAAASLYAGGVVTVGTMTAVFLSTSDEMLPILISGKAGIREILFILGAKVAVGMIAGFVVDVVARRASHGRQQELHIHEICERDHCRCEGEGIVKPALIHCMRMLAFAFAVLLVIRLVSEWIGMEELVKMAAGYPFLCIFLTGLIGMIPNCAVSVAITTLYLEGVLTFGSMFAGLLSCSGLGLLVLLKTNRNWKTNTAVMAGIYGISVLGGMLMEWIVP